MKKYDFEKDELWFSLGTLRLLVCASTTGFARFVLKMRREVSGMNGEWREDMICLLRAEGKRMVRRQTRIFDLATSYSIIKGYQNNKPSDFRKILKRFAELSRQNWVGWNKRLLREVRKSGMATDFIDEGRLSERNEILELMVGDYVKENNRRRLIVDSRNNDTKVVLEKKYEDMNIARPLFKER